MILNNTVNAKNFIYCMVYFSPNETNTYFNEGHGHFHQELYHIDGTSDAVISSTSTPTETDTKLNLVADTLYNLDSAKGKFVITSTKDVGASMMMFNPIPHDRKLNVEIVKGPTTIEVVAGGDRTTVVCITGPVIIKGKRLESQQYATVFADTTASLEIPLNGICALVKG
jgi:hypothetical protein